MTKVARVQVLRKLVHAETCQHVDHDGVALHDSWNPPTTRRSLHWVGDPRCVVLRLRLIRCDGRRDSLPRGAPHPNYQVAPMTARTGSPPRKIRSTPAGRRPSHHADVPSSAASLRASSGTKSHGRRPLMVARESRPSSRPKFQRRQPSANITSTTTTAEHPRRHSSCGPASATRRWRPWACPRVRRALTSARRHCTRRPDARLRPAKDVTVTGADKEALRVRGLVTLPPPFPRGHGVAVGSGDGRRRPRLRCDHRRGFPTLSQRPDRSARRVLQMGQTRLSLGVTAPPADLAPQHRQLPAVVYRRGCRYVRGVVRQPLIRSMYRG